MKRYAIGAIAALLFFATASLGLDRMINGNTYQAVVRADPVTGSVFLNAAPTDRSGTIAVASTSQQVMAANPNRRGFTIQNTSASALWVNDIGAPAAAGGSSFQLAAGATLSSPLYGASTAAVNILGATTTLTFAAREW